MNRYQRLWVAQLFSELNDVVFKLAACEVKMLYNLVVSQKTFYIGHQVISLSLVPLLIEHIERKV